MGHRGFVVKEEQKSQKKPEHPYTRTPNPNARNYLDEMAPVNGIVEFSQEVLDEARKEREALRDAVSKRMGELLLRGVTMLDAYCQVCNGILMEDRNGARTCVTCELCAEKVREGSKKIAEIDLEDSATISTAPRTNPGNGPGEQRQQVVVMDCDRSWANEEAPRAPKKPVVVSRPKPEASTAPSSSFRSSVSLAGYNAAFSAIDAKLAWAADKLTNSTDIDEIRLLIQTIGEGMAVLRSC